MDASIAFLARLAAVFGPALATLLILAGLTFVYAFAWLMVRFGHHAFREVMPFFRLLVRLLTKELVEYRSFPAVRLEILGHIILFVLVLVSIGFLFLHALVVWGDHRWAYGLLIGSSFWLLILMGISVRLAARLPLLAATAVKGRAGGKPSADPHRAGAQDKRR